MVLLLGLSSFTAPLASSNQQVQAQAQPMTELRTRPAITTENDRILVYSLVKSTLLSLNQANQTNNYSVLRALGSPEFQMNNTDDGLAEIFRGIKDSNLDFAAIVEFQPVFTVEPSLDSQNSLRVKGYFPTTPNIEFDLLYQLVNGRFLVDVLTVGIAPTNQTSASESQ